jgi:hypothetical protein
MNYEFTPYEQAIKIIISNKCNLEDCINSTFTRIWGYWKAREKKEKVLTALCPNPYSLKPMVTLGFNIAEFYGKLGFQMSKDSATVNI